MTSRALTLDALGTYWWITSPEPLPENRIRSEILDFQKEYSRFDPKSNLGQLNDTKCFVGPSDEFLALLTYGVRMFIETRGLFNMSVGARLEQDGYGKNCDPHARISQNLESDIEIHPGLIRIAPHVRLDFGGFGKGWLIDKIGALLKESGINTFIINGGGDILVGDTIEPIFVEHPFHADEQIGTVKVQNSSLASSSKQKRTWITEDGRIRTHIISPNNNASDSPLSVHVHAKSALYADTFGTVFLLTNHLGRRKLAKDFGLEYMEINQNLQSWQTAGFGFLANS